MHCSCLIKIYYVFFFFFNTQRRYHCVCTRAVERKTYARARAHNTHAYLYIRRLVCSRSTDRVPFCGWMCTSYVLQGDARERLSRKKTQKHALKNNCGTKRTRNVSTILGFFAYLSRNTARMSPDIWAAFYTCAEGEGKK